MKKILCLLLALIMVLGLAACGAKDSADDTKAPAADDTKAPADNAGEDAGDDTQDPNREAKVVFMTRGSNTALYYEEIKAGIEQYVKDTYNLDFELKLYSDYFGDAATPLSTGEGWDVAFINGTSFLANVGRNLFLPLDEYLEAGSLPTAQEVLPEKVWQAGEYNGNRYGIFPTKDWGCSWNILVNKEALEETGYDIPTWKNMSDYTDWMWEVGEKWLELHPDQVPFADIKYMAPAIGTYDALLLDDYNVGAIAAVNVEGITGYPEVAADTVYCPILTEQYKEALLERIAMHDAGIIYAAQYPEGHDDWAAFMEGELVMWQGGQGYLTFPEDSFEGFTTLLSNATEGLIYTAYLHAGFWVVNAKTADPERTLDFVEALFSDEQLCTMMRFGIEGEDWTDTDGDNQVEFEGTRNEDPTDRSWYYWYGFEKACLLTGKVAPGNGTDFADKMWAANDSFTVSQCAGFVVDATNIQNELTALTAVQQKYAEQIKYPATIGGADAAVALLEQFEADLMAAGLEKVLAEVQAQYDAFVGK